MQEFALTILGLKNTSFFEFDRTIEIMIASFSLPWNPSTVEISISFNLSSLLFIIFSKTTYNVSSSIVSKEYLLHLSFENETTHQVANQSTGTSHWGHLLEAQRQVFIYLSVIRGDNSNVRS